MDPNEREYSNRDITVHWKPSKCIHATTCYRELIEVFNPRNRPWVNMEGASSEKIIEIVKKCPTDALTYDWNDLDKISEKPIEQSGQMGDAEKSQKLAEQAVEIRIMKNGPYVVEGDFSTIGSDGQELKQMLMTSFCRCGVSEDMPFCDGSHRLENFTNSCD